MKPFINKISLFLAACLILSACGTKGPLYIPEQQYPQPTSTNK